MGASQLQDVPEMLNMRKNIRAEDQDIINVNKTIGQITQDLIHHPLEGVPRVPESEGKAEKFEHPKRSDDCCLGNVLGGHWNLVVSLLQVQPRENS